MAYWLTLTRDNLPEIFAPKELEILSKEENQPYVEECLADITAEVREAIANNAANKLDAEESTIPRTLKTTMLDIVAVRLLKRFNLTVTDARKEAAAEAREKLVAIAQARYKILQPDGTLPDEPSSIPVIISPDPAYGNDGTGFYPSPNNPRL